MVLVAACRTSDSSHNAATGTPAAAGGEATANVVTVTAHDFAFDAPTEIPAGLTTIRLVNQGPSYHHLQLIKLNEGKTMEDLFAGLKAGGPIPQWAVFAGGPNPSEVGGVAEVTLSLEAGNYAMVCFIPAADGMPHVMKGMARALTVTPSSAPMAAAPEADITVKLVDFSFELSKPLTAGKHVLEIENDGTQVHEIAIVRLNPGKTPADFTTWGEKPVGPSPGTLHGGVSGIMPGMHAFAEVDLPPGDYALLCFYPDAKDGKPHFVHGMVKEIKVS